MLCPTRAGKCLVPKRAHSLASPLPSLTSTVTAPFDMVIRTLFHKHYTSHGNRHCGCTCWFTCLPWFVALLYSIACGGIVGFVAINGLFSTQGEIGRNDTDIGVLAKQVTSCEIKESFEFAAEWAILVLTSFLTWALISRPASITFIFFLNKWRHSRQDKNKPASKAKMGATVPVTEEGIKEGTEEKTNTHTRQTSMVPFDEGEEVSDSGGSLSFSGDSSSGDSDGDGSKGGVERRGRSTTGPHGQHLVVSGHRVMGTGGEDDLDEMQMYDNPMGGRRTSQPL